MTICHHQPPFSTHHTSPFTTTTSHHPHLRLPSAFRCNLSLTSNSILVSEPEPVYASVRSFAPATVANLGPGFDFLGCAVDGIGDHVTVKIDPQVNPGEVSISDITGAAPTKKMRAVLPTEIPMSHHVWNSSQAGALVAAVLKGDLIGLGKALSGDRIVEPKRAPLIPGMDAVKQAALLAGALGCTIGGAGPTAVAVTDDEDKGREIGEKMVEAFMVEGKLKAVAMVKKLDRVGARLVSSSSK